MSHHPPNPWPARMATLGHALTAAVLALKAASYFDYPGPRPWAFIVMCLAAAALIAGITAFHHQAETLFAPAASLIYLAESAVCAVLAVRTHLGGKVGLPYAWALAALLLGGYGAWLFRKKWLARQAR